MTEQRLAQLLAEVAEGIPAPYLARVAWETAARVRRRRRIALGGATAVLAAAIGGGVALGPAGAPRPAPDRPPATGLAPAVHGLPASFTAPPTGPPPVTIPDFRTAKFPGPLDTSMNRAVWLVQPSVPESGTPQPVYAWTDDDRWVRVDVRALDFTRDASGNRADPLTSTSLSPDGRRAAFPQQDRLFVANLTNGTQSEFDVPGFNERVRWLSDEVVLVGGDTAASTVDVKTGAVRELPGAVTDDLVADVTVAGDHLDLHVESVLHRRGRELGAGPAAPISDDGLAPHGVLSWYGPGWRRGDLVVRAGYGHSGNASGLPVVAVVDLATGTVVRLLDAGEGRGKDCCEALGWLDGDRVLLRNNPHGLAAWNIRTGAVSWVAGPFPGVVAVA